VIARGVNRRWVLAAAFTIAAAATLSALGAWNLARQSSRAVARVLVGVSPASQIARTLDLPNARPFRSAIALSPDGQSRAFIGALPDGDKGALRRPDADTSAAGSGARQLYVRRMDRLNATPIEGTDRAESPFFSPDGQWVGFWQAGRETPAQLGELKKVPLAGGPVVTLCRMALPAGISWAPNGRIIFANHAGGGLWQVADAGGTPEELTTPDSARGELSHRLPHVLPDGRAVLFTVLRSPGAWDDTQVAVRSLVTGEQTLLAQGAADARYVTSGHIVYARMGTLLAQPFDATRLQVTGKPVGVVQDVMQDVNSRFTIGNSGAAQFSVASNGTLAYLPGGVGWYRKMFTVPDEWLAGKVYLHFDGVYCNSTVWINGHRAGGRANGFIPSRYDITQYLLPAGEINSVAVQCDHSRFGDCRWYTGSGINRSSGRMPIYDTPYTDAP